MVSSPRDNNRIPAIMGVSSADGVTPVLIYVDPITHRVLVDSTGTSGVTFLDATGDVNDVNVTFTFISKPIFIISDGVSYRENHGWTWAGLTATLSVPPQYDIWGTS